MDKASDPSSHIEKKLQRIQAKREEDRIDDKLWGKQESEKLDTPPNKSSISRLEAKSGPFIRRADDEILNKRLRSELRWDDPARSFTDAGRPERRKFRGSQNRFDIEPGDRWDGIDRSNGFEMKLFQKNARRQVIADLSHQFDVAEY